MDVNMLKSIRAVRKFTKALDINHVALDLLVGTDPLSKRYEGLEKRNKEAYARDKFCRERGKIRPKWKNIFLRTHHFVKANELLNYIRRRNERKK